MKKKLAKQIETLGWNSLAFVTFVLMAQNIKMSRREEFYINDSDSLREVRLNPRRIKFN